MDINITNSGKETDIENATVTYEVIGMQVNGQDLILDVKHAGKYHSRYWNALVKHRSMQRMMKAGRVEATTQTLSMIRDIQKKLFAELILCGWNITEDDGNEIPFSKGIAERLIQMMTDFQFDEFVDFCTDISNFEFNDFLNDDRVGELGNG